MSAVGIDTEFDLTVAGNGPSEISRRLESLQASSYLWRLVILLSLGGCFEIYDLFLTGYIAPGLNRSGLLTTHHAGILRLLRDRRVRGRDLRTDYSPATFFLGFLADRFRTAIDLHLCAARLHRSVGDHGVPDQLRRRAAVAVHRRHRHRREVITIDAYITELVPSWMPRPGHSRGQPSRDVHRRARRRAARLVAGAAIALRRRGAGAGVVLIGACRQHDDLDPAALCARKPALAGHATAASGRPTRSCAGSKPRPAPIRRLCEQPKRGLWQAAVRTAGFADCFKAPYFSLVVLFMVFNFCQAFGFYGFANWVPTLLVEKGITITKSLQYSFIVAFAYPIAPPHCGELRRPLSSANGSSVGACVAIILFGISSLAIDRTGALDRLWRVADRGEHDDVLRLPRLSDRGVPDRDPRPRRGAGLFD